MTLVGVKAWCYNIEVGSDMTLKGRLQKKKPQTWAFCPTSADPPLPSELGPPYQITHF